MLITFTCFFTVVKFPLGGFLFPVAGVIDEPCSQLNPLSIVTLALQARQST
jgi:hypothetical protein